MAFSGFDLWKTLTDFALTSNETTDLFAAISHIEASDYLRVWLDEFAPVALVHRCA